MARKVNKEKNFYPHQDSLIFCLKPAGFYSHYLILTPKTDLRLEAPADKQLLTFFGSLKAYFSLYFRHIAAGFFELLNMH